MHIVGKAAIFDQGNRVGMVNVRTDDVARDKDVTLASLGRDEDACMIVPTRSTGESRDAYHTGRAVRIKGELDNDNFAREWEANRWITNPVDEGAKHRWRSGGLRHWEGRV